MISILRSNYYPYKKIKDSKKYRKRERSLFAAAEGNLQSEKIIKTRKKILIEKLTMYNFA